MSDVLKFICDFVFRVLRHLGCLFPLYVEVTKLEVQIIILHPLPLSYYLKSQVYLKFDCLITALKKSTLENRTCDRLSVLCSFLLWMHTYNGDHKQ